MDASLLFGSAVGGIAMFYAAPKMFVVFVAVLSYDSPKVGPNIRAPVSRPRYRRIKQTALAMSGYSCGLHNNKDDGA
jgi:hypothetical protein